MSGTTQPNEGTMTPEHGTKAADGGTPTLPREVREKAAAAAFEARRRTDSLIDACEAYMAVVAAHLAEPRWARECDADAAIERAHEFVFRAEKEAGISSEATLHVRTLLALLGRPFVHPHEEDSRHLRAASGEGGGESDLVEQIQAAMRDQAARKYDLDLERTLPPGLLFSLACIADRFAERHAAQARAAALAEAAKIAEQATCGWCEDGICLPNGAARNAEFRALARTIRAGAAGTTNAANPDIPLTVGEQAKGEARG